MNFHLIDIVIILFLSYFAYSGLKHGLIRELTSIIAYISAFLLSKITFSTISNELYLELFIPYEALRDKIAYLLSFVLIVYCFRVLSQWIEKFIDMKWQNKLLGCILGIIKGMLIFALIISIFEAIPMNVHQDWNNKSSLYRLLDNMQKDYLVEYVNKIKQ